MDRLLGFYFLTDGIIKQIMQKNTEQKRQSTRKWDADRLKYQEPLVDVAPVNQLRWTIK